MGANVSTSALSPRKVGVLEDGPIVQLECGSHSSLALTKAGKVYTWLAETKEAAWVIVY